MNLYKRIFVSVAISVLFLTSNSSADLLEKCIKYNGDINNNGTVSKFERKICNTKLDTARLIGEGKRLDEEGKKLDAKIKKSKEKLGKLLNKK